MAGVLARGRQERRAEEHHDDHDLAGARRRAPARNPLTRALRTTPGKVLAGVAAVVVLAAGLGALVAVVSGSAGNGFGQIGSQDAPLVEQSTGLYFSVNDMDAQVANVLLTGNDAALAADRQEDLTTYAADRRRAEQDVQQVAVTAAANPVAQKAVGQVLDALGRYEALAAESILLNQRGNDPAGKPSAATLNYFQQATDLMRTGVLPAANSLTSSNAAALTNAYAADKSAADDGSGYVLVLGIAVVAALAGLQLFFARRYHRLFNPVLAAATVVAAGLAIAGAAQLSAQATHLTVAKQDAFDSIIALTQAREISYDANADESRWLVDPARATMYQNSFLAKSQQIANVGNAGIFGYDAAFAADISAYQANDADVRFGGYLGAEFRNITFPGERAAATSALLAFQIYERDDRKLRALAKTNLDQAIAFDIGTSPGQSDWAFNNWAAALGKVTGINQNAFTAAIHDGNSTGSGWNGVIPAVAVAAIVVLTVAGTWRRLAEYR